MAKWPWCFCFCFPSQIIMLFFDRPILVLFLPHNLLSFKRTLILYFFFVETTCNCNWIFGSQNGLEGRRMSRWHSTPDTTISAFFGVSTLKPQKWSTVSSASARSLAAFCFKKLLQAIPIHVHKWVWKPHDYSCVFPWKKNNEKVTLLATTNSIFSHKNHLVLHQLPPPAFQNKISASLVYCWL